MGALDNLLGFNGTFGTGSPAEEAEKPTGPVGNLLLGLARSAATLPQRAIQNSQFALNTGNYDPSVPMEAALGLTGGAGIVPAEANSLRMGIKAYHGSPHDFDAFSMDKIGTGEGAQAYGHGLYFADNEGVAKSYRDKLTTKGAVQALDNTPQSIAALAVNATGEDAARQNLLSNIKNFGETHPIGAQSKAALDAINDGSYKSFQIDPGHMYEVNINADPAHFLDWDKPLWQQPEHVQDALFMRLLDRMPRKQAAEELDALQNKTGDSLYRGFSLNQREATQALADEGIPGIKYLDQGSRGAGEGSSNYVVFKDDIINIVRKYAAAGIAVPPAIMAQYQKINEQQ